MCMHRRRRVPRALKWTGWIWLALVLTIRLDVIYFDWNWLRGPISRRVRASVTLVILQVGGHAAKGGGQITNFVAEFYLGFTGSD